MPTTLKQIEADRVDAALCPLVGRLEELGLYDDARKLEGIRASVRALMSDRQRSNAPY